MLTRYSCRCCPGLQPLSKGTQGTLQNAITPPLAAAATAAVALCDCRFVQTTSSDTAAAMQLFEDVAYGDVEQGSIYDLSEANLIKVRVGTAYKAATLQHSLRIVPCTGYSTEGVWYQQPNIVWCSLAADAHYN